MPILHSDHSVYRMFTRGKNLFLRSMGSMAWHYLGSPKKSHPNVGKTMLVGGFNHLEKYESQLGLSFQIRKIKNVPNHQSECHKKEYMVFYESFHNLKKTSVLEFDSTWWWLGDAANGIVLRTLIRYSSTIGMVYTTYLYLFMVKLGWYKCYK